MNYEYGGDIPQDPAELGDTEQDPNSLEDVRAQLQRYEDELRDHGLLPPPDPEEKLLEGGTDIILPALSDTALEFLAEEVKGAWSRIGLVDPGNVTPRLLNLLSTEKLLALDRFTAESLYFATARKIKQKLGNEPVTTDRLMAQIQPPKNPAKPSVEADLDAVHKENAAEGLSYLFNLTGIDQNELRAMLRGSPSKRQNIIRLHFLLNYEPTLKGIAPILRNRSENHRPMSVERVVKVAKFLIDRRLSKLEKRRALQERDSIDHELYSRLTHRLRSSKNLGNVILRDMKVNNVDDFIAETGTEV